MPQLTGADKPRLLDYISGEPEMNLFLYGDIENYGLDGDAVHVYALEEPNGEWSAVLLQYYRFYTLYSRDDAFDAAQIAAFLADRDCGSISGKASALRRLAPHYPERKLRITYLSRCIAVDESAVPPLAENARLVRIAPDGVSSVVHMLATIDEFRDDYTDPEDLTNDIERISRELTLGSVMYAVVEGDEIVATASTSASNSISAMVMAVATRADRRGRGYASNAVAAVCRTSLAEGKRFLCLFYDNPDAGRIYRSIGFTELGEYAILR